ncbi:MAG: autotransporter-associated beta strand repeat-containing protein [Kiritimatiellia bacterium]
MRIERLTSIPDLSNVDPETALIRVIGSLSKNPYQVFKFRVNTNNTVETAYKIISASDLDNFADYDFCLEYPWIGNLSLVDNGTGGKDLVFTPTPSEKIAFMNATDGYGESAFFNTHWTDNQVPSAGKTYAVRGYYSMRTPPSGDHTFAGDKLIFDDTILSMKGSGIPTVTNMIVMNNAGMSIADSSGARIAGNIYMHPLLDSGSSYSLGLSGYSILREFTLYASLYGYGDLKLYNCGDPSSGFAEYTVLANNTDFFGRVLVYGVSNFSVRVTSEANLGGPPPAFREDQLQFNGGGISVVNDVVFDDVNRGIMLLSDGGVAETRNEDGAFLPGTPEEDRRYEGGAVFRVENSSTLTIDCPITGRGHLLKDGVGTVVLGGNNSYTGITTIAAGSLCPASPDAFGSGPVEVKDSGRLLRGYSDPAMPNGVELGGPISFVNGGAVLVELAEGETVDGNFSVPLFLLPEGESIDPATVPVEHSLDDYIVSATTSSVGSRQLVSAEFSYQGLLIILQ